ncbi:LuxR C-terminal-related transcriptional regulator [Agromyces bauzanensis]
MTLLVAPAGSGKTVLLQEWAESHASLPLFWIDVEPGDDDVVAFSSRVRSTFATAGPEFERPPWLGAIDAGTAGGPVSSLAVDLGHLPELVIVLDDLHHLRNDALLEDLGRFTAALPANVHVVISSRVDPPIAWSRLRLRSRILEIRQADLAMSGDESAQLLARITRRDVSPATRELLLARTEGWATGLQLAALALRFHNDPETFVAEFGGTDRFIAEYLTEEVLDALPAESRDLLLRMSPLDVMSAELLDHVLERSDGRKLIERFEHESMFLIAMDERRETFRFHQLFRDLLRFRLRTEDAARKQRLLVRAAEFHLDRGEREPAIEYLLRAREWNRSLDVIMTLGSEVLERNTTRTVIRWIMTVPEVVRAERLDVALELGILYGMQGEAGRAVEILGRVANDPHATIGEQVVASVWTSATAQWNARSGEAVQAAERGLAQLAAHLDAAFPDVMRLTTPEMLMIQAIGSVARSHFLAGDLAAADAWLTRALTAHGAGSPTLRVGILGSLALLRAWCGRLREAELLVAEALDTASGTGLLAHPVVADTYFAAAMVAYERGYPDVAHAPLKSGTIQAEEYRFTQLIWIARYQWAVLAAEGGQFDEALRLADESTHDMPAPAPAIHERMVALQMNVLRRTGRSRESLHLPSSVASPGADLAFESAAAWLTIGNRDQARRVIAESVGVFQGERPRDDVRRLQVDAWSAELDGDHPTALELIGTALDRAEPEQLVEVFLNSDAVILDLVAELAASRGGVAMAVVERSRRPAHANAGLVEPLTGRELEVLAYLPEHSTGPELARLCRISINTLRTHLAHIYRKLGVSTRTDAIGRARELGLLNAVIQPEISRA